MQPQQGVNEVIGVILAKGHWSGFSFLFFSVYPSPLQLSQKGLKVCSVALCNNDRVDLRIIIIIMNNNNKLVSRHFN